MYQLNFEPVLSNYELLLYGTWLTIRLSLIAMVLGLIVSVLGAMAKTSTISVLRWIVGVYVEVIRNTPFLVQIFFIYFGLPAVGISMSPNTAALTALVVNVGAYGTEIIRAGIEAIPQGQIEAGRALSLSRMQVFRYIIIKPALRSIYPSLTSQFIYLLLTSSVVSAISANDLASIGADLNAKTFASFEIYLILSIIYFVLSLGFSTIFIAIRRLVFTYPLSR